MVALIPGSGGRRRIPRKHIRPCLGVLLVERTIAVLQATHAFERIADNVLPAHSLVRS